MDVDIGSVINWIASSFFSGSTTLASLAIVVAFWAVALVFVINAKAPYSYSVVPMIIQAIFMASYGYLNSTIQIMIVIVQVAFLASEYREVVS